VSNPRRKIQPGRNPAIYGRHNRPARFDEISRTAAIARPVLHIEESRRAEHDTALASYKLEAEEFELRMGAWKQQCTAAFKSGSSKPPRPDGEPKPPTQGRLIIQDATFEKLHELMVQNPAGLLVVRDELTGWLAELDRQGREGERAFYLSAWNGDTPHSIERIGRGSICVPACCVSVFGGIQPARLRSYLQDALQDGPANDGLMQRFQILVGPTAEGLEAG